MRPAKGNEIWQRGKQFIVFYDKSIYELPVAIFDTVWEIVEYKGLEKTKSNYTVVMIDLIKALRRESPSTRMLGKAMTVYLIDIHNEEDEIK